MRRLHDGRPYPEGGGEQGSERAKDVLPLSTKVLPSSPPPASDHQNPRFAAMGKLTNLKSSLGGLAPRSGYAPGDAKAADKSRNQLAPCAPGIAPHAGQKLRQQVFVRDA